MHPASRELQFVLCHVRVGDSAQSVSDHEEGRHHRVCEQMRPALRGERYRLMCTVGARHPHEGHTLEHLC